MTAASGSRGGSSVSSVKRCVIVGATSGIGRALAQVFAEAGYEIGITGRRAELLASLAAELPTRCCTRCFDVCGDDAMAEHAYITRRWRLIAWLLKLMPDGLYNRIN